MTRRGGACMAARPGTAGQRWGREAEPGRAGCLRSHSHAWPATGYERARGDPPQTSGTTSQGIIIIIIIIIIRNPIKAGKRTQQR